MRRRDKRRREKRKYVVFDVEREATRVPEGVDANIKEKKKKKISGGQAGTRSKARGGEK